MSVNAFEGVDMQVISTEPTAVYLPWKLAIRVLNNSEKELPPTLVLFKATTQYYQAIVKIDPVTQGGEVLKLLTLKPKGGATPDRIKSSYNLELQLQDQPDSGSRLVLSRVLIVPNFYPWTKGLDRYAVDAHEKAKQTIMMFGPAGSGKSAFINTIFTCFSEANEINYHTVQTGGGADHTTVRLWSQGLKHETLRIMDTFGVDDANYQPEMLEHLLDGKLPEGWHMEEALPQQAPGALPNQEDMYRQPHAIIFFFPWADFQNPPMLSKLEKLFQVMKDKGHNPIVLLAMADSIDADIRKSPSNPSEDIKNEITKVAEKFNIGEANIFPCVPYLSETTRTFEIDCHTYKIVEAAARAASTKYRQLKEKALPTTTYDVDRQTNATYWENQKAAAELKEVRRQKDEKAREQQRRDRLEAAKRAADIAAQTEAEQKQREMAEEAARLEWQRLERERVAEEQAALRRREMAEEAEKLKLQRLEREAAAEEQAKVRRREREATAARLELQRLEREHEDKIHREKLQQELEKKKALLEADEAKRLKPDETFKFLEVVRKVFSLQYLSMIVALFCVVYVLFGFESDVKTHHARLPITAE